MCSCAACPAMASASPSVAVETTHTSPMATQASPSLMSSRQVPQRESCSKCQGLSLNYRTGAALEDSSTFSNLIFASRINDRVISANNASLEGVDYATAVQVLRDSGQTVNLVVKRRVILPNPVPETQQTTVPKLATSSSSSEMKVGSQLQLQKRLPGHCQYVGALKNE